MSIVLQSAVILLLGGTATLAVLLLLRGIFFGYPAPSIQGLLLSRKEQAIVGVCADTLFPSGGPIPLSGTEAGVVAYVDRYVARLGRPQRLLIRLLLHAVEHSPLLFDPRSARFTRLSPEERIASLRAMSTSRIYLRRVMFLSLRMVLTMAYLANDEVARRVGIVARIAPFEPESGGRSSASPDREPQAEMRAAASSALKRPELRPPRKVLV